MAKRRHISRSRKLAIHEAHNGICHWCKAPVELAESEFDHVVPFALGGADEDENLGPVHYACHKEKTKGDVGIIAKAKRVSKKHLGTYRRSRNPMPCGKDSNWKKPLNKNAVRREPKPKQ